MYINRDIDGESEEERRSREREERDDGMHKMPEE